MTHLFKKIFFVLLLALSAMLVSCNNNSAVKAGNHLQIRMHDFPIQDQSVEKVIVEIKKIEVNNSVSGWMTVSDTDKKYDLLELQNGKTVIILDSPLPIGTYDQIRLELNPDNEIIANNLSYPLTVPSGTESGIKLITPFEIEEGKMVEVTLDFDAQKSVNYTKGDGFHLKPVIKVEKITEYDAAGWITPEGGNVTTFDGVLNIQVPAGAVSQNIIVTAEKADISALPAPDDTLESVGIAYDLGPDGQTFNSPVLLSFHYNEADLVNVGSEEDLVLYWYDETTAAWEEVPSTVLASADTVQAWVNHFSLYALFILPKLPAVITLPNGVIGHGRLPIPPMPVFQDDNWSCGIHSSCRLMRAYSQFEDYNSMRNVIGSYELKLSYDYTLGQYIPNPLPPYPCPTWRHPTRICYPPNLLLKYSGSKDITIDTGVGKPDKILVADLQKYRPTFRTADLMNLTALLQKIDSGKPVMTILQLWTNKIDLHLELADLLTGLFILGPSEIRYPQLHWVVVNGYDSTNIYWYDTTNNTQQSTDLTTFYKEWDWQKESFDYVIRRLLEDEMGLYPRTMMWIDETLPGWVATSFGPWQSALCNYKDDPSSCWNSGTDTCDGDAGSAYVCPAATYGTCYDANKNAYICPVPTKTCNDVRNYQYQVGQDTWDYRTMICGN